MAEQALERMTISLTSGGKEKAQRRAVKKQQAKGA